MPMSHDKRAPTTSFNGADPLDPIDQIFKGLRTLTEKENKGPALIVVSPAGYQTLRETHGDQLRKRDPLSADTSVVGHFLDIPVVISRHMPEGAAIALSREQVKLMRGGALAGLGTVGDMATRSGVTGTPIFPAKPLVDPLPEPYCSIASVDIDTCQAFDKDGNFLLELTLEGAVDFLEQHPSVRKVGPVHSKRA
jgi:hypothetical protein